MYNIGENIHIISPRVKEALAEKDGGFFVDLAAQAERSRRQRAGSQHRAPEEIRPGSHGLAGGLHAGSRAGDDAFF